MKIIINLLKGLLKGLSYGLMFIIAAILFGGSIGLGVSLLLFISPLLIYWGLGVVPALSIHGVVIIITVALVGYVEGR